jgi:hypothetical protein
LLKNLTFSHFLPFRSIIPEQTTYESISQQAN